MSEHLPELIGIIGMACTAYLVKKQRRGDAIFWTLIWWPGVLIWLLLSWRKERRERELERAVTKYLEAGK